MKILALINDTLREIYARKAIIGIVVIEALALLVLGLILFLGMQSTYREARESEEVAHSDTVKNGIVQDKEKFDAVDTALLGMADKRNDTTDVADTAGITLRPDSGSTVLRRLPADSLRRIEKPAGDESLREMVKGEMHGLAVPIAFAFLFFGIFISAGIVPSMMEKGNIDLLISKPISRTALLLGRALGGLLVMATNLFLFLVAIWALYGLASGIWYFHFIFWTFGISLFAFTVIYSGIILLNVLTESWVLPMIIAYIHLMILSNFLSTREFVLFRFIENGIARGIITGLYYILPQTNDLVPQAVFEGSISSLGPFIQGAIFTAVMLGLAAWRFERRDF